MTFQFSSFLIVALGGAFGASLRFFSISVAIRLFGSSFPWGTLFVNVVGSLLMGIIVEWISRKAGDSVNIRLFLMTGLLGGFTTFSAYSLDFANLWEKDMIFHAFSYLSASVLLSIAAVFAGLLIGRNFF